MSTGMQIKNLLASAFAGGIHAETVNKAAVEANESGYRVWLQEDDREAAYRIARHFVAAFGADPESGYVTVSVTNARTVEVHYDRVGGRTMSDTKALDELADAMAEPGRWDTSALCETAADLIKQTGRRPVDAVPMCVTCGKRPWGHGYCGEECKHCASV